MAKLFANSGDPDQTPHSAASDLGLHCLPITLLRVSRLQWVKLLKSVITTTIIQEAFKNSFQGLKPLNRYTLSLYFIK